MSRNDRSLKCFIKTPLVFVEVWVIAKKIQYSENQLLFPSFPLIKRDFRMSEESQKGSFLSQESESFDPLSSEGLDEVHPLNETVDLNVNSPSANQTECEERYPYFTPCYDCYEDEFHPVCTVVFVTGAIVFLVTIVCIWHICKLTKKLFKDRVSTYSL